jgi:hypothetical protein
MKKSLFFRWAALVILIAVAAAVWHAGRKQQRDRIPPTSASAAVSNSVPATTNSQNSGVAARTNGATNAAFSGRPRPLLVARRSATHEWTDADGKAPEVIQQIAHNPLEYERMLEENSRIKRLQLVYRNDTAAAVLQRSRLNETAVTQLTLPGLDGQELVFEIEHAELAPSKQTGNFSGRLANQPDSLVTVAFQFGREAFTILAPAEGLYLQAHPREPGELILTSFDPENYLPQPGGPPIITTNTFKIAQ